jgi:peptide/nickel transport system permease protein
MRRYIVRRLLQTLVLLWLITVVTFVIIISAPGGPAILYDPNTTAEEMAQMRKALGLDQPIHVQYWRWLTGVLQGNFGVSYTLGAPVSQLIAERLPPTLLLSGAALLFAVFTGIPLGVWSAVRRNGFIDHLFTTVSFFGLSMPVFWYGLVLILTFSVQLKWLPAGGIVTVGQESVLNLLSHLVLPAVVLGTVHMAEITRYARSSMIGVLQQDYIRTARAKGLRELLVVGKHGLKNALIPLLTVIGLMLPRVAAGAAITEQVFAWPGMGQLAVRAAFQRDYPTIMGVTLVVSVVVALANLVTDLIYTLVDPRVRFE